MCQFLKWCAVLYRLPPSHCWEEGGSSDGCLLPACLSLLIDRSIFARLLFVVHHYHVLNALV